MKRLWDFVTTNDELKMVNDLNDFSLRFETDEGLKKLLPRTLKRFLLCGKALSLLSEKTHPTETSDFRPVALEKCVVSMLKEAETALWTHFRSFCFNTLLTLYTDECSSQTHKTIFSNTQMLHLLYGDINIIQT